MKSRGAILTFTFMFLTGISLTSYYLYQEISLIRQRSSVQVLQNKTTSVTKVDQSTLKNKPEPISISIPKFHIVAPIQPVGLDSGGRMATIPNAKVIAWYAYGSAPGQPGNSILAGHRDWNNALGSFWNLDGLSPKDLVSIKLSNGQNINLQVLSIHSYLLKDVPPQVMDLSGEERTTLISCVGAFIRNQGGYQSRVIAILRVVNQGRN